jgi:alginate O-acetyltransferase complex protein AlgI
MFGANGAGVSDAFAWQLSGLALATLAASAVVIYLPPVLAARRGGAAAEPTTTGRLAVIALFILAVTKLMAQSYSPFLYFQF